MEVPEITRPMGKREKKWMNKYKELIDYVDINNKIPLQKVGSLGRWCSVQRRSYRSKKLSEKRIELLKKVPNWYWDFMQKPTSTISPYENQRIEKFPLASDFTKHEDNKTYLRRGRDGILQPWTFKKNGATRSRTSWKKGIIITREQRKKLKLASPLFDRKKKIFRSQLILHYECIIEMLYIWHGIEVFSNEWLNTNSHQKLYYKLCRHTSRPLYNLTKKLTILNKWNMHRLRKITKKAGHAIWTREHFNKITEEIVGKFGFFPPAAFLVPRGYGSWLNALYNIFKENYETLQKKYNVISSPRYWGRNGEKMDSMPEACYSNFLYARGIEQKHGPKYPDAYTKLTGRKSGKYDRRFKGKIGIYKDKWIDVEIWGDKPLGHAENDYAKKKAGKILFNKDNKYFLEIHWKDCYYEEKLISIMEPYIGIIAPFVFDKETDYKFKSIKWSILDEVTKICKYILSHINELPPKNWFLRKGLYKNRIKQDWEEDIYKKIGIHTLFRYITYVGGVKKIRKLLKLPLTRKCLL